MHRRDIIKAGGLFPLAALAGRPAGAFAATAQAEESRSFDDGTVPQLARALATRPYQPPQRDLPAALDKVEYDQYRDFRYRAARALWREQKVPFQAQFFHRGFLFKDRVDVFTVQDGLATPFAFSTDLFDYAPKAAPKLDDIGFAGFRLHAPINRADYFDEVCTFLGASYFRAVAKGLTYGLSARGLALGTGDATPEEFPVFKSFWLEQPAAGAMAIVVHALLDSPRVAGAFRFRIVPGTETVFDVDARLFPRVALAHAGIAPLTSMFFFDPGDRDGVDDYRAAVHDSDGLALYNGAGEQVWRPLTSPSTLQGSGFQDRNPRGFGLMQRKRAFAEYHDAEANYQTRPSLWVEPLDPWGDGAVQLVEIPTHDEYHDNIVAFWRPRAPLAAGREHRFRYRLHWCRDHRWLPALAVVTGTRIGAPPNTRDVRQFVVDFAGGRLAGLAGDAAPTIQLGTSAGEVSRSGVHRIDEGHWRMTFEFRPGDARVADLRAQLADARGALGETWIYRWTA